MMHKQKVVSFALVVLMSFSSVQIKAGDKSGMNTLLAVAGLVAGGVFVSKVYAGAINEFTTKEARPSTSFSEDLFKVGGICITVPAAIALAVSPSEGCKSITNAVIGGAAYLAVNRMVEKHDIPFWPIALATALYTAEKAGCLYLNIPMVNAT